MAKDTPLITLPDSGKDVSIERARREMEKLTIEAADLREDDSSAAKARRIEIARHLRAIQNKIDALEEVVEVIVPPDASKQFPFRIGPKEFWPGTYMVRASIAQTLRYMMDRHRDVENNRVVAGGNAQGDSLGRDMGAL